MILKLRMMEKNILLLIAIMSILATQLFAQTEKGGFNFEENPSGKGTSAAAFLEIGIGARAESMGGAYSAQKAGTEMIYWNPSGIAWSTKISASFMHSPWLAETSLNHVGLIVPVVNMNSVIGFSFTALGYPEQLVRTVDQPQGTGEMYDALDYSAGISIATRLLPTFAVGGSVKYVNQRIWSETAHAIAFDVGVRYETPLDGLAIGSSISNFGADMKMSGRNLRTIVDPDPLNGGNFDRVPVDYRTKPYPLPQLFRFGLSYDRELLKNNKISLAVDLLHPSTADESINLGAEYAFFDVFFLRGGYQNLFEQDAVNGLTLGAGIKYILPNRTGVTLDYGWSDWGILTSSHKISFKIDF